MTTTPTFWIAGDYKFSNARTGVDILATPDDGFRVDAIAFQGDGGEFLLDQYNIVTPYGDHHLRSKSTLGHFDSARDIQTTLLANGEIGKAYIFFPDYDPVGEATVHLTGTTQYVTVSDANMDCYAMFESVALSDGGVLALWGQTLTGDARSAVAFRRVAANGDAVGGVVVAPTAGGHEQTNGIMTKLADDTIVIGWDDGVQGATTVDVTIQLYSEAGFALGDPLVLGSHAAGAKTTVQALAGGGYVVAWDDATANQSTLQLFAADGTALGAPLTTTGDLTGAVTALHDGGFVLGISEGGLALVQRFSADGAAIGDAVAGAGELATLADGRFVVANTGGYTIYDPRDYEIAGTSGDDVIYGRLDGSDIAGMQGNDTLTGSDASDLIHGGDGDDKIQGLKSDDQLFGSSGNDTVGGGRGNDLLDGGAGDDSLNGSYDDDTLLGAAGADTLRGGSGADVFAYTRTGESGPDATTRDTIVDFEVRRDRIDVHQIDADRTHAGQQAFTFIGTAAFSGVAQIRYEVQGSTTLVQADTNGDGQADLAIALKGALTLDANNFVLTDAAAPPHAFAPSHGGDWPALLHLA